jgi:hypothetical protein
MTRVPMPSCANERPKFLSWPSLERFLALYFWLHVRAAVAKKIKDKNAFLTKNISV